MTHETNRSLVRASLAAYLHALQESGVDGIPVSMAGTMPDVTAPVSRQPSGSYDTDSRITVQGHETLEKVRRNLGACTRCRLGNDRNNLLFGRGNPQARLVFVGEWPETDDDPTEEPFAGEAGKILNRIITAMGLKREDVYVCTVVKCRPPGGRDPEADEIGACSPLLLRQLQSINPEAVVALGALAAQALLGTKEPVVRLRGKFRDFHGIPLMPTHPPSYLLRKQQEGSMVESFWEVWDDMTQVLRLLKLPVPEKSRKK